MKTGILSLSVLLSLSSPLAQACESGFAITGKSPISMTEAKAHAHDQGVQHCGYRAKQLTEFVDSESGGTFQVEACFECYYPGLPPGCQLWTGNGCF